MNLKNIDYNKTLNELKKDVLLREVYYNLMNSNKAFKLSYHNNIHSLTMAVLMFEIFRKDKRKQKIATLSGLLHDFNHTGKPDSKSNNIKNAKAQATKIIKDKNILESVLKVIFATEYPYKTKTSNYLTEKDLGEIIIAMRLADHAWQNIFPFDIASLGIHKEQYKDIDFRKIEIGSTRFRKVSFKEFKFLLINCPEILRPLFNLYLELLK